MAFRFDDGERRALVRAIAFVAVGVALAYLINGTLLHGLRQRRTGYVAPWNAIADGRLTVDLVVVGSSRAMVDVDCAPLTARLGLSCFNLGLDGSPINLERPLFETYIAHNSPPKVLLLTVDVFTFRVNREPFEPSQYLPHLAEAPVYDNLVKIDPRWRLIRYVPLYGFAVFGLDTTSDAIEGLFHLDRRVPDWRIRGWAPRDWPWDGEFEKFARTYPHGRSWPIDQEAVDALESILRLAERHHSRIVLAYPPEYVEAQRLSTNRDTVFAKLRDITQRHNVPFLDFSNDPLSANRSLFYNSEHMNRRGAELFSSELAERIAEVL